MTSALEGGGGLAIVINWERKFLFAQNLSCHLIINPLLTDKYTDDDDARDDDENPKSVLDRRGHLRHATQFIETGTDLPQLLSGHFGSASSDYFGIVGLHTCGNLAADSIKVRNRGEFELWLE